MQGGAPSESGDRGALAGMAFGLAAALSWALYVVGSHGAVVNPVVVTLGALTLGA